MNGKWDYVASSASVSASRQVQVRVANVIEEGKIGGPQLRMVRVAQALAGRVDTTIIMPQENSEPFQRECKTRGVDYKVHHISRITKDWKVALRYAFFLALEVTALARTIASGGYDIVHVSGGSWQYKGMIAGKLVGKKVVWHLNDTSMPRIFRAIFAVLNRFADGFIFASERSQRYYQGLIRQKKPEFVVPAPVDTVFFSQEEVIGGEEVVLARWCGKTVVGAVANVNPAKDFETFIRMAARVNRDCSSVQFVILGAVHANQNWYYKRLRQLASELQVDNLEFLGARSDVRPLLKRFDVYVCSSVAESSPMAVWEAMSMAKPIVSTAVGDVALYVEEGENGFITEIGDWKGLAERLTILVKNEKLRRDFGQKSRKVAIRELDIEQCAQRHLDVYHKLLDN